MPASMPIPGAVDSLSGENVAKLAYQNALARIGQQRTSILQQAGYTGNFDPSTGAMQNLSVDPNAAYGGLQTMLRGQAQEDQASQFAGQERGLHGGLANQGLSQLHYEHGGQDAAFGQGLTQSLSDEQMAQADAAQQYNNALYESQLAHTQQAIQDQNFSPADYSGLGAPDYGTSSFDPNPGGTDLGGDTGGDTGGTTDGSDGTTDTTGTAGGKTKPVGSNAARNHLLVQLHRRGVMPSVWARTHATQAQKLGISPVHNANNQMLKKALAAAKPKPKPKPKVAPRGRN